MNLPQGPTSKLGVLIPLCLLVIGGCWIFGCIPLPGSYRNISGDVRPEQKIGGKGSLIELGQATRQRVLEVLGDPKLASDGGRVLVYRYSVDTAALLWPLCGGIERISKPRYLVLHFDSLSRLNRYQVRRNQADAERAAGTPLEEYDPRRSKLPEGEVP